MKNVRLSWTSQVIASKAIPQPEPWLNGRWEKRCIRENMAFGARDLSIRATHSASSSPRMVAPYM